MSTYDARNRHLRICRYTGVTLKAVDHAERAMRRQDSWANGTVTYVWKTFPVLVKQSGDRHYPLLIKPAKLVPYSEFDSFFGFRTAGDYDAEAIVAVKANTYTVVSDN